MSTTPSMTTYEVELKAKDKRAGMSIEEVEHFTRECRRVGFAGTPKVFVGFRAQVTRMVATVTPETVQGAAHAD